MLPRDVAKSRCQDHASGVAGPHVGYLRNKKGDGLCGGRDSAKSVGSVSASIGIGVICNVIDLHLALEPLYLSLRIFVHAVSFMVTKSSPILSNTRRNIVHHPDNHYLHAITFFPQTLFSSVIYTSVPSAQEQSYPNAVIKLYVIHSGYNILIQLDGVSRALLYIC